jgi:hypothetical protein
MRSSSPSSGRTMEKDGQFSCFGGRGLLAPSVVRYRIDSTTMRTMVTGDSHSNGLKNYLFKTVHDLYLLLHLVQFHEFISLHVLQTICLLFTFSKLFPQQASPSWRCFHVDSLPVILGTWYNHPREEHNTSGIRRITISLPVEYAVKGQHGRQTVRLLNASAKLDGLRFMLSGVR